VFNTTFDDKNLGAVYKDKKLALSLSLSLSLSPFFHFLSVFFSFRVFPGIIFYGIFGIEF
jgi:hypothetical protein